MKIAGMSSGGPWYPPLIMAHAILGHRFNGKGGVSYRDVEAQIETKLGDALAKGHKAQAPSLRMVQNWEREQPGYPEQALRLGLIRESDLLPWARAQLSKDAGMSQLFPLPPERRNSPPRAAHQLSMRSLSRPVPFTTPAKEAGSSGAPSLAGLLAVGGLLWLAARLLQRGNANVHAPAGEMGRIPQWMFGGGTGSPADANEGEPAPSRSDWKRGPIGAGFL